MLIAICMEMLMYNSIVSPIFITSTLMWACMHAQFTLVLLLFLPIPCGLIFTKHSWKF